MAEEIITEDLVTENAPEVLKGRIHIRGTGYAEKAPDLVILSLTLTAQNKEYSAAMKIGSQQLEMLRESIIAAGFKADDLKTTNFNVTAIYADEEYKEGKTTRYRKIFDGFECRHDLKLTLDFDNKKLNKAVDTIAACLSQPKISIAFTIKDMDAFNDEILRSAARDARRKAKILCSASKVKLGKLLDINYSWNEITVRHEQVLCDACPTAEKPSFDFQPEELKASDTVDFLWEIES